jgi:SOUL heme-binding protein
MFKTLLLAAAIVLSASAMPARAIEEPAYTVERRLADDVEIRAYTPYVVAEVRVQASADEAGNEAFPILAGYIFGKNKGARKMAMTAPVTQAPAEPVKLAMTAPVTQTPADGGYRVQFVLPSDVGLATAPEPLDPRVSLREEPAQRLAVIRYRGFWSDANYGEHLARLQDVLRSAGLAWRGEPVYSRYDPPITPWFLRRNEIWLRLE